MDNRPIGIFDSGVGGLTVAKQIMAALPHEGLVYFGDSLRMPYGERDADDLEGLARRIITFLMGQNIKALVVACGSISAKIMGRVQDMVPAGFPIFDMVTPAIDATLAATKSGHIGVLATAGTIASGTHERCFKAKLPHAQVVAVAAPLFAPLVEEGWVNNEVARLTAKIYLEPFADSGIDTLLLACTHFPLMHDAIAAALPPGVAIVDPAVQLAAGISAKITGAAIGRPQHQFYVTAKQQKFDQIAQIALGMPVKSSFVVLP